MKKRNRKQIEEECRTHTSVDSDSAQLVEMVCANCGASLEVVDKTRGKCPFCGQTYLIDEAKGIVVNVSVDYGGSEEVKQGNKNIRQMVITFFIMALLVTAIIFRANMAANNSAFFSSDSDAPIQEKGNLLVIFCKDIFRKEYRDITAEEFASIRYLKYDYRRDERTKEWYHTVEYSFTDYEACGSEEEFLDTVQTWTYEDTKANWPSDFTMLTGLTRIDTRSTHMRMHNFAEDCKISYIATDDSLEEVASAINPRYVKVLDMGEFCTSLEGLEQFENLEVLKAEHCTVRHISGIKKCSKLKHLKLSYGGKEEGLKEIAELSELISLSLTGVELSDGGFLKKMPQLEELTMRAGENADLSILSYLPNLRKLDIGDDTAASIEPILGLARLEDLTVSVDSLENMSRLAELKKLKTLHLYTAYEEEDENGQDKPLDLSVFSRLPELESFYISSSGDGGFLGAEGVLNLSGLEMLWHCCGAGEF